MYQTLLTARRRKPNVPVMPEHTADFMFLRYIGHPKMEINEPLLDEWADYVASQLEKRTDAYVICHSPENLTAPWLCRELYARVRQKVKIPPLPWDAVDSAAF